MTTIHNNKTKPVVNIKLKRFDMSSIAKDAVIALLGKRRTGKSTLVKDILYNMRDMPIGTVICPTEQMNRFFNRIIPSVFIHYDYNSSIVEKFIERQTRAVKIYNRDIERFGNSQIDPRAFIILDDCMYDNSWINEKGIKFLFMNGRHIKSLFMFTLQYPLGVPPLLRTNIDYTFILKEPLLANRKRIYESYAGVFPSFDIFCEFMNQCTNDFECLVINNSGASGAIEDCVFWYKADPNIPPFRLGDDVLWQNNANFEDDPDLEAAPPPVSELLNTRTSKTPFNLRIDKN